MDNQFIESLPIPSCIVDEEGCIKAANHRMNKVFPYEDIVGLKFFTLTGVKREQLYDANHGEIIVDRNGRVFKLWVNDDAKADEDVTVFFDEVSGRETFRARLERERAAIVHINIDNYDELIASAPEDYRRVIPSQIDGILRKWGNTYDSPVISTGDERYVMYTNRESIKKMVEDNFSVLDEVRDIEPTIDFPVSISIGAGISDESIIETQQLAESALELALGRGGDQAVLKTDEGTTYYGGSLQSAHK